MDASNISAQPALLHAFDLIEHDGNDLCDLTLIERKRRLARLIGRASTPSSIASIWR